MRRAYIRSVEQFLYSNNQIVQPRGIGGTFSALFESSIYEAQQFMRRIKDFLGKVVYFIQVFEDRILMRFFLY